MIEVQKFYNTPNSQSWKLQNTQMCMNNPIGVIYFREQEDKQYCLLKGDNATCYSFAISPFSKHLFCLFEAEVPSVLESAATLFIGNSWMAL